MYKKYLKYKDGGIEWIGEIHDEFYKLLEESDSKKRDELKLILFEKFPKEYQTAKNEAWHAELGNKKFHQDGLVHISKLAKEFVKNPLDIVKVHQQVNVKVIDIDIERKRISLSMVD